MLKKHIPYKQQDKAKFECVYRGYERWIVLIPGWAADYRVFSGLDLGFNYIFPVSFFPGCFEQDIIQFIKCRDMKKISLLGWSLGGFVAADFALRNKDLLEDIILIGIRKKYEESQISHIKGLLCRNKKGYLNRFYSQCFFRAESRVSFHNNFGKNYCEELRLDYLVDTLDALSKAEINPEFLKEVNNIKIIHGRHDKIAPIDEAAGIKDRLSRAEFIIAENSGHIPFLEEDIGFCI